ncbi:MAG: glycosyltransferase, partial [Flavobacteriales bacterium]|nr:glycosyltransferase [Flavobacteriales bacterium]
MVLNKVLYITPGFPSDEGDTTCIPALQDFFAEMERRKIGQEIITLHYPTKKNYAWKGHLVTALGWNNPGKLRKVALLKNTISKLKAEYKLKNIDLIHSFWMTDASYLASKLAEGLGIPHVVTVMGQDVDPTGYFKQIIKLKPAIVTLSSFQDQLIKKQYDGTQIIPWGICIEDYKVVPEKTIDIISVGSLINLKRIEQTIELTARLKSKYPDIKVSIVGDGPERGRLEELTKSKQLQGNVEF